MMTPERRAEILDSDIEFIDAIVDEAIALAVEEHRRLGHPIAVWRDGRVVWIPPEEIPPYTPPAPPNGHTG